MSQKLLTSSSITSSMREARYTLSTGPIVESSEQNMAEQSKEDSDESGNETLIEQKVYVQQNA